MTTSDFDPPREKLQAKGVSHLSDAEILQLLIGSGNAKNSVAHIARKTKKALQKYGSAITYDQLLSLSGIGEARASLVLAAFELARRYPVSTNSITIDTEQNILELASDVRSNSNESTIYMTLDGARRLIAKRHLDPDLSHSRKLRSITSHYLFDNAASVIIVKGAFELSVIPDLDDLQFAKELHGIMSFFNAGSCTFYLANSTDANVVLQA